MAVSTLLVARVPAAPPPELERAGAADGARALAEHPGARLVVGLLAAQYLVFGALDVLFVVFAVDVLGLGQSGAGYLNSAFGAGGVIGVAATAALVGRARLVPALAAGMGAWCAACVVLALWPSALAAFVLLAVAGAGRNVFDVAGRTLLQRSAPPEVLGRVFGLLEGLAMAAMAVGALLTPVLIEAGGAGLALAATAALLPALALLRPRRLAAVDRHADVPVVEVALLRRLAPMRALAAPDIERLARCLTPRRVGDGEVVIRQGDDADALYVVASGTLDVLVDGAPVNVLERGECFGEIGLLDDRPRTASVAARGEALVMALGRDDFLSAMAGSPRGAHEARQLADRRLAALDGVRANYEPCAPRPTSSAAD
jgi:hypothetical protein